MALQNSNQGREIVLSDSDSDIEQVSLHLPQLVIPFLSCSLLFVYLGF